METGTVVVPGGGMDGLARATPAGLTEATTATLPTPPAAQGSGATGGALGPRHRERRQPGAGRLGSRRQRQPVKVSPNGFSKVNPDASGKYPLENRWQFANHGNWVSSDYLLNQLAMDPATTQKRLGDGFYEQRLVRDQLNELTGRAPNDGPSDDSRYKALLTSGVSFAEQCNLRPGIALTADQIGHLTSDIV